MNNVLPKYSVDGIGHLNQFAAFQKMLFPSTFMGSIFGISVWTGIPQHCNNARNQA